MRRSFSAHFGKEDEPAVCQSKFQCRKHPHKIPPFTDTTPKTGRIVNGGNFDMKETGIVRRIDE